MRGYHRIIFKIYLSQTIPNYLSLFSTTLQGFNLFPDTLSEMEGGLCSPEGLRWNWEPNVCNGTDCSERAVHGLQINVAKTQGKLKGDQVVRESPSDPDHIESRCPRAPAIDTSSKCIPGWEKREDIYLLKNWLKDPSLSGKEDTMSYLYPDVILESTGGEKQLEGELNF